jgi:hypothetical protein
VIVYKAVPYLVLAAPSLILLLTILVGGCTMTRTANESMDRVRYYSDPNSRAGDELVRELDRRAAREDLRRAIEEPRL